VSERPYTPLRIFVYDDGDMFVARDRILEGGYQPEHAVIGKHGHPVWVKHDEGGQMQKLVEGGRLRSQDAVVRSLAAAV